MSWVTIGEWKEEHADDLYNFAWFKVQCDGASIRITRNTNHNPIPQVVFSCRLDAIQDKVLDNR